LIADQPETEQQHPGENEEHGEDRETLTFEHVREGPDAARRDEEEG
jgi:hypothetical protein